MAGHYRSVWLGLPAGFLHGARTQESWYCCFVLLQTLHSVEALHLPMPDTSALPWEWMSLTNLPDWITCGFRAAELSFYPQFPQAQRGLVVHLLQILLASVTHPEALSKPESMSVFT